MLTHSEVVGMAQRVKALVWATPQPLLVPGSNPVQEFYIFFFFFFFFFLLLFFFLLNIKNISIISIKSVLSKLSRINRTSTSQKIKLNAKHVVPTQPYHIQNI